MSRRLAYVLMSWDLVLSVAQSRPLAAVDSDLPGDAQVAYLELIPEQRQVRVYFESVQNEPVYEGSYIPEFKPTLVTRYPGDPSTIPYGESCPICGPQGHAGHADDSYGGCVICREYVPHTDDEYIQVRFPCPAYRLEHGA